jgi:hypothetical protein
MFATLTPAAKAVMGASALAAIGRIDNIDFGLIIKSAHAKMRQLGIEPRLSPEEAESALKQFYALSVANPDEKTFAVSSVVDDYWHSHILYTAQYRQFCQTVFGGFMDHVPLDKENRGDVEEVRELYTKTHAELKRLFGDTMAAKAYPEEPNDLVIVCRCLNNCEPDPVGVTRQH